MLHPELNYDEDEMNTFHKDVKIPSIIANIILKQWTNACLAVGLVVTPTLVVSSVVLAVLPAAALASALPPAVLASVVAAARLASAPPSVVKDTE